MANGSPAWATHRRRLTLRWLHSVISITFVKDFMGGGLVRDRPRSPPEVAAYPRPATRRGILMQTIFAARELVA